MELKYYLRGLGLGILVTAIIMSIAASKKRAMTDDEIIARAKQLGMIEDSVLTEINAKEDMTEEDIDPGKDTETTPEEPGFEDQVGQPEPDADIDTGEEAADVEAVSQDTAIEDTDSRDGNTEEIGPESNEDVAAAGPETDEDTESTEPEPETADNVVREAVVIVIGRGDGSYTVSRKLAEAGVVPSAGDYDTFLCANGYDKRIRSGTFTIPADASDEQIARIITGME